MYKIQIKICEWVDLQRRESWVSVCPKGFPKLYETRLAATDVANIFYPNDEIRVISL